MLMSGEFSCLALFDSIDAADRSSSPARDGMGDSTEDSRLSFILWSWLKVESAMDLGLPRVDMDFLNPIPLNREKTFSLLCVEMELVVDTEDRPLGAALRLLEFSASFGNLRRSLLAPTVSLPGSVHTTSNISPCRRCEVVNWLLTCTLF